MLKNSLKTIRDLFFPLLCIKCGRKIKKDYLCLACQNQIEFLLKPACYTQIPFNQTRIKALSICSYHGPIQDLVYQLKYNRCDYLAEYLGKLMIKRLNKLKFSFLNYDFIVPVPMHPYKIKSRGYNQAKLLANQLANYFKLPLKNDIISSDYIQKSQTKLSPEERRKNVEDKFRVAESLKNKNIILFDDILTTGATTSACWKALKEKEANSVYIITLAK